MEPVEDSCPQSRDAVGRRALIVSGFSALVAYACRDTPTDATSDGSSTTTSTLVAVAPTATATPDPAPAVTSTDKGYTWQTTFTVTLTETAGLLTTVKSLSAVLQQAAGGIIITPPTGITETYRYQVRTGSNQVGANSTLPIDFDFFYTLPNGGRQALVTLTFNVTDANGNSSTVTLQVKVA